MLLGYEKKTSKQIGSWFHRSLGRFFLVPPYCMPWGTRPLQNQHVRHVYTAEASPFKRTPELDLAMIRLIVRKVVDDVSTSSRPVLRYDHIYFLLVRPWWFYLVDFCPAFGYFLYHLILEFGPISASISSKWTWLRQKSPPLTAHNLWAPLWILNHPHHALKQKLLLFRTLFG